MATQRTRENKDDPWGLDSGLPNDCDITVTKSQFGFLDAYQNGEAALLMWDVESPDADFEYPIIWPLGSNWKVRERGKTAVHEKRNRFVETSMIGRLIQRSKDIGAEKVLRERGSPTDASIWEGLSFHIIRETIPIPGGGKDGIPTEIEHLMPTEFLGEARQRGRSRRAVPARAEEPSEEEGSRVTLEEKLTKLAKNLSIEEFQKAAMKIEELENPQNSDLLSEVLEDSDEGFWAKAQAELPF